MKISAKEKVTVLTIELSDIEVRVFKNILYLAGRSLSLTLKEKQRLIYDMQNTLDNL